MYKDKTTRPSSAPLMVRLLSTNLYYSAETEEKPHLHVDSVLTYLI
jgi:hypothetical protein